MAAATWWPCSVTEGAWRAGCRSDVPFGFPGWRWLLALVRAGPAAGPDPRQPAGRADQRRPYPRPVALCRQRQGHHLAADAAGLGHCRADAVAAGAAGARPRRCRSRTPRRGREPAEAAGIAARTAHAVQHAGQPARADRHRPAARAGHARPADRLPARHAPCLAQHAAPAGHRVRARRRLPGADGRAHGTRGCSRSCRCPTRCATWACRRCCCSRWWKTASSTGWSRRSPVAASRSMRRRDGDWLVLSVRDSGVGLGSAGACGPQPVSACSRCASGCTRSTAAAPAWSCRTPPAAAHWRCIRLPLQP